MMQPVIKALHIVFMVTWFAGLFYLPRLFVYHAMAADREGIERYGYEIIADDVQFLTRPRQEQTSGDDPDNDNETSD